MYKTFYIITQPGQCIFYNVYTKQWHKEYEQASKFLSRDSVENFLHDNPLDEDFSVIDGMTKRNYNWV